MALAKKAAINEPQAKKEVLAAAAPLVAIIFQGMNFKRLAPKFRFQSAPSGFFKELRKHKQLCALFLNAISKD